MRHPWNYISEGLFIYPSYVRPNRQDRSAQELWSIYIMQTQIEEARRALKGEPGQKAKVAKQELRDPYQVPKRSLGTSSLGKELGNQLCREGVWDQVL